MATESMSDVTSQEATKGLASSVVYFMAGIALVVGLAAGYYLPGTGSTAKPARAADLAGKTAMAPAGHPAMTLDQMKGLADSKAAPLLEKLKSEPKNGALLAQVGGIYSATHQFQQASDYYRQSIAVDPKNVKTRTDLASSLFYSGDADGAIEQLQQALKYKPKDVNALFNLGMVKYRGKDDAAGAIASWQELLKTHPDLDRKKVVEQLIAEAKQKAAEKK